MVDAAQAESAAEDSVNFAIVDGVRAHLAADRGDIATAERLADSAVTLAFRMDIHAPGLTDAREHPATRVSLARGGCPDVHDAGQLANDDDDQHRTIQDRWGAYGLTLKIQVRQAVAVVVGFGFDTFHMFAIQTIP